MTESPRSEFPGSEFPTSGPPLFSGDEIFARLGYAEATRAVRRALVDGFDPAADIPRQAVAVGSGELLLMPSETAGYVGVKIVSVAPGNGALGRERIQGVYLLMDAESLSPVALLDGTALTTLRTPAVSAVAAELLAPEAIDRLVVFGSGPQAWGHIEAIRAVRPVAHAIIVGRDRPRAESLARRAQSAGLDCSVGNADDVAGAQLIVCATTASTPLFDGSLVADDSLTIAVGSHEPDARELDSELMRRAQVVVEDIATARRSAGDVVLAEREGALDATTLVSVRDLVAGSVARDTSRPRVFKSVGMGWEDLVVAGAVWSAK